MTYYAGKTYIKSPQEALQGDLITGVVEGSGQPFYYSDSYNGVNFNFTGKAGDTPTGAGAADGHRNGRPHATQLGHPGT